MSATTYPEVAEAVKATKAAGQVIAIGTTSVCPRLRVLGMVRIPAAEPLVVAQCFEEAEDLL